MIDFPGLSDSKGINQEVIDKIRKELKEKHCRGIKSILFVEIMWKQDYYMNIKN